MNRKSLFVAAALVIVLLASLVIRVNAGENAGGEKPGRYQLFEANTELFKIDTQTGQVWLYSEAGQNATRPPHPEECKFIAVN